MKQIEQPAALAEQQDPVAWKHDCAALLTNDVELWIDACPHCGKPRPAPQPKREPLTDEEIGQVRWQCRWNRMSTDDNVVYATTQQLDAFARAAIAAYERINVYTAPQPRRRLTDEEIDNTTRKQVDDLLDHIYEYGTAAEGIDYRLRAIARAIEAAVWGDGK